MVIAVVAVREVQVAVYKVADVVAVGHGLVTTIGSMHVACLVTVAAVVGCARRWIGVRNLNGVLVHMVAVWMVQMPIVQIIHMAVVFDGSVAASRTVYVVVVVVFCASVAHSFSRCLGGSPRRKREDLLNQYRYRVSQFIIDVPALSRPAHQTGLT